MAGEMTAKCESMGGQIVGEPTDLWKVLSVVSTCGTDWPKQDKDFKDYVIRSAVTQFGQSFSKDRTLLALDTALDSCLIVGEEVVDPKSHKKRYVLKDTNEVVLSHDLFCFDCHILVDQKSQQFLKCDQCCRVFHRKPVQQNEGFECAYCKRLNVWERDGYIGQQRVDPKGINVLIGYLFDCIETKMKDRIQELDLNLDQNKCLVVFKPMDLSLIRAKVLNNEYKSVSEFEDDFLVFMHNLSITSLDSSVIAKDVPNLRQCLAKELEELRECVDCYERSHNKALHESNKDWFCEPCEPPHKVVFVKVKGWPHWPAKVIHEDGGKVSISFFDSQLRRMDVKPTDMSDINNIKIKESLKRKQKMIKPLEMLDKYLKSLDQKESLKNSDPIPGTSGQAIKVVEQLSPNIKVKENTDLDQTIEEVIEKSQRKRGRKKKIKSSTAETTEDNIPLLTPILSKTAKNSVTDSDNENNGISSMPVLIAEPPILTSIKDTDPQLKGKRRSVRISSQSRSLSERPTKTMERNISKGQTRDGEVIDMNDESKQMEMEVDVRHPMEEQTDLKTNATSAEKNETKTNDSNVNESQTTVANKKNESISEELAKSSEQLKRKMDELMATNEQTIATSLMKEELILIQYYQNQQINALMTQLRQQLVDSSERIRETKCKNWCVVCKESAKFYCCLRYFCSDECQTKDWLKGHYRQCLAIQSQNSTRDNIFLQNNC